MMTLPFPRRVGTAAVAGALAIGALGACTVPAMAVGGQEGTSYGQTTPGVAVWGASDNNFLGSFKVPTAEGLDDGVWLDASAENPRTEFNTAVTYNSAQQVNTKTLVSGANISEGGMKRIVGATSVGKDISTSKGLNDNVKALLKSYGYDGDFGQSWGMSSQGLNQPIAQKPGEPGNDGQKIPVTQGDYVMMAVSAVTYNGANPGTFATPVPTSAITGQLDVAQGSKMTDDFNSLVTALQKASDAIDTDVVNAADVQMLTFKGNDASGQGEPNYRRAISFNKSKVLNVTDMPTGTADKSTPTPTPSDSASSYDPSGQNKDAAKKAEEGKKDAAKKGQKTDENGKPIAEKSKSPEPTKSAEPTKSPSASASPSASSSPSQATVPASSVSDDDGDDGTVETVTPQEFETGTAAGTIQANTGALVGALVAALAATGALLVRFRKVLFGR